MASKSSDGRPPKRREPSSVLPLLGVLVYCFIALVAILLARGLPPRTFFSGDSGVKLIAARNAIAHPMRPFDITLPRICSQPVDFLDPFFRIHGDHAHAAISQVFPVASAPLIAAFGMRGAFVLPALGFLLAVAATASVGVALDNRRSRATLLFVTAACTPLLFYALEFWEHALGVGVAALATALFVRRHSRVSLFASGLLIGTAIVLRPEAVCYGAALFLASRWLPNRPTAGDLSVVLAGVAVICLPLTVASAVHSGQMVGSHVERNMSGLSEDWWSTRLAIVRAWFVPGNPVARLILLFSIAALAVKKTFNGGIAHFVGITAVALIVIAAARRMFELPTVWNAAPLIACAFWMASDRLRQDRKFLFAVALVSTLAIVLTAPADGGSQWGPRLLLFVCIPGAILATDALGAIIQNSRSTGMIAVFALLVSSVFVQRNAYRELRGGKRTYERIVEFVEHEIPAHSYIVTDLWWFDQVTAALYPTRVVLFVNSAAAERRALGGLATCPQARVFIVRSKVESRPDSIERWLEFAPFAVKRKAEIPERALTIADLRVVGSRE